MANSVAATNGAGTRLTTAHVNDFLAQARRDLAAGRHDIDLAAYEQVDSAAVAALLALRREPQGGQVRFLNPSDNLRKLGALYDVESLLFPT